MHVHTERGPIDEHGLISALSLVQEIHWTAKKKGTRAWAWFKNEKSTNGKHSCIPKGASGIGYTPISSYKPTSNPMHHASRFGRKSRNRIKKGSILMDGITGDNLTPPPFEHKRFLFNTVEISNDIHCPLVHHLKLCLQPLQIRNHPITKTTTKTTTKKKTPPPTDPRSKKNGHGVRGKGTGNREQGQA